MAVERLRPNSNCFRRAEMSRLFAPCLPPGFQYREDFIPANQEQQLIAATGQVTFAEFEMRGVVARRRVAFFGESSWLACVDK